MPNPKFESKVKQNIVNPHSDQRSRSGYAIVMSYDSVNNTANIQMSRPESPGMGQVYKDVPCPTTIGVQAVAPEMGRPCFVDFKGNGNSSDYYPVITTFFNHVYSQIDYTKQTSAVNNTPRYILGI